MSSSRPSPPTNSEIPIPWSRACRDRGSVANRVPLHSQNDCLHPACDAAWVALSDLLRKRGTTTQTFTGGDTSPRRLFESPATHAISNSRKVSSRRHRRLGPFRPRSFHLVSPRFPSTSEIEPGNRTIGLAANLVDVSVVDFLSLRTSPDVEPSGLHENVHENSLPKIAREKQSPAFNKAERQRGILCFFSAGKARQQFYLGREPQILFMTNGVARRGGQHCFRPRFCYSPPSSFPKIVAFVFLGLKRPMLHAVPPLTWLKDATPEHFRVGLRCESARDETAVRKR